MKHNLVTAVTLAIVTLAGTAVVRAAEPVAGDAGLMGGAPVLGAEPATCDSVGSEFCCDVHPKWTVSAGAVFLRRNDPEPRTLLVDPVNGSELMNTLDLRPGWGAGPRFEIARRFDSGLEFEVELFSIDNWSGSARAQNARPSIDESFWDQFVFNDVQASYSTELFNLECNLRWPLFGSCWLKGLAGFRYARLEERFTVDVALDVYEMTLRNQGQLRVNNDLYGFQIGVEPVLWNPAGPLRVDGFLKAGIYGNSANWDLTTQGDLDNRHWHKKGCHAAFIGEVALMVRYDFCCCRSAKSSCGGSECGASESCGPAACTCAWRWSVFGGYEALWLAEVATIEQWKRIIRYDKAFYHGAVVGIEIPLGRSSCCHAGTSTACN